MIYSSMSFPLKVLWVVKKRNKSKWIPFCDVGVQTAATQCGKHLISRTFWNLDICIDSNIIGPKFNSALTWGEAGQGYRCKVDFFRFFFNLCHFKGFHPGPLWPKNFGPPGPLGRAGPAQNLGSALCSKSRSGPRQPPGTPGTQTGGHF